MTLGGRGVTTTSDGRGPPVSPPLVLVVLVVLLWEAVEQLVLVVGWTEERLGTGTCLTLIQVWAV